MQLRLTASEKVVFLVIARNAVTKQSYKFISLDCFASLSDKDLGTSAMTRFRTFYEIITTDDLAPIIIFQSTPDKVASQEVTISSTSRYATPNGIPPESSAGFQILQDSYLYPYYKFRLFNREYRG